MILRGIFIAPKDCVGSALLPIFDENGKKFVEAMDRQGWELKSALDFCFSPTPSDHDRDVNHYTIYGEFRYRKPLENIVFEDVPQRVIKKIEKRLGRDRVKILK